MAVYNVSYKIVQNGDGRVEYGSGNMFMEANIFTAKDAQKAKEYLEGVILKSYTNVRNPLLHILSFNKL